MNRYLIFHIVSFCVAFLGGLNSAFPFSSKEDPALFNILADMNLPLVVINTVDNEEPTCDAVDAPDGAWGYGIANATKVPASMQIILRKDTVYDSGDYIKKESGLTVKIRGNSSGRNPKKSFKLKLQKKADLLLRDDKKYKDKDWVLLRSGGSLVTPIGLWTSELIGQEWTPAHDIVNVWMNGSYRGLYILCEQVTVNTDCRIVVDESDGYVVESDPYWWNEEIYFPSTLTVPQLKFTYKYPDPEDITDEWNVAISNDVIDHEARIKDGTFDEVFDCESFAKWLVGWELLGNADSAGGNMYVVKKDSSSKICMGPMWDFDNALIILDDWIGLHYRWFYFHHLLQSPNDSFRKSFYQVWKEKGSGIVDNLIDRINTFADSPAGEDYQVSIGFQMKLEIPADYSMPYIGNLEFMRSYAVDFLTKRAEWIDSHIDNETSVAWNCTQSLGNDAKYIYDILGRFVKPEAHGFYIVRMSDGTTKKVMKR
ncbi:MAG: CotH kinase family protein [Muribaculaceae bacterium]|nr:CotH kinase family protein [Muribaculaceae bacterium]